MKKNSSIATIVACVRGIQKALVVEEKKDYVISSCSIPLISSGPSPSVQPKARRKSKSLKPIVNHAENDTFRVKPSNEKPKTAKKKISKSIGLVLTGVNTEDKQIIYSSYHTIQSDLFSTILCADYETVSCTHVIAGVNDDQLCQRTVKYLLAVLEGKWIVSVDWYLRSLSAGQWLPEKEFEVKGDQINGATDAPRKGRLCPNSLFKELTFFIEHDLDSKGPRREEVLALIKAGNGHLLTRRPTDIHNCVVIKSDADKKRLLDMISMYDTGGVK